MVAVVVKYADNILKGFAASFSIITACIISYIFLDFQPTILFICGAALVLMSSFMYEKGLPPQLSFLRKSVPLLFSDVPEKDRETPSLIKTPKAKEEV